MLELEARRRGLIDIEVNPEAPKSPREAATVWYGVPKRASTT